MMRNDRMTINYVIGRVCGPLTSMLQVARADLAFQLMQQAICLDSNRSINKSAYEIIGLSAHTLIQT